jgi:hypothetical protein
MYTTSCCHLEKMNTIEVLTNSRGNPVMYFSEYFYTQHRMTKEKRIFRCENRNCRRKLNR